MHKNKVIDFVEKRKDAIIKKMKVKRINLKR